LTQTSYGAAPELVCWLQGEPCHYYGIAKTIGVPPGQVVFLRSDIVASGAHQLVR
jgi:hypothetical protein